MARRSKTPPAPAPGPPVVPGVVAFTPLAQGWARNTLDCHAAARPNPIGRRLVAMRRPERQSVVGSWAGQADGLAVVGDH